MDRSSGPLSVLVVASVLAVGGEAGANRVEYTGRLLVTIEGPRAAVDHATEALADVAGLEAGEPRGVLLDVPATTDDRCPDPTEFDDGSGPMRRVLVLRDTGVAALGEPLSAPAAWDSAYDRLKIVGRPPSPAAGDLSALTDAGVRVMMVEPDLVWIDEDLDRALGALDGGPGPAVSGTRHHVSAPADGHWPRRQPPGWHLRAAELDGGRALVENRLPGQTKRVVIGHFDTGFTACDDRGLPPDLRRNESWDFTAIGCSGDECAPNPGGEDRKPTRRLNARGHGTGTLSILAGGPIEVDDPDGPLAMTLGGAPFARVVEYRLAEFVAIWEPSVVASALNWAAKHDVDVVSMSMGGLPSFTLHQAVNIAYCRGVAMFAAAGNNVGFGNPLVPLSSPRTTVFPARYDRVMSVVGVTGDERTYAVAPWRWDYLCPWRTVMRGNAGPDWVMSEAIAAWTPNLPWLVFREAEACADRPSIRLNGSGTSAATPQVAAAAAQWLQYYIDDPRIANNWRSWQKVEAVYEALLQSARPVDSQRSDALLGRGILRAATAIQRGIPVVTEPRPRARLDTEWIASAILSMLRAPATLDALEDPTLSNMLATEIAQLALSSKDADRLLDAAGRDGTRANRKLRRDLLRALSRDERASQTLRTLIRDALEAEDGGRE
jgi:subtilisin family serine protease